MKVVCQRCNTENRAIAKFCIECVSALPTISGLPDFAPAESVQPRLPSWRPRRGAARMAPASAPGDGTAVATPRERRGLWFSIAAFVVALLIGATGWLLAGAGALYIYRAAPIAAPAAAASESSASAPLAAAPPAAAPAPAPLVQAAPPVPVAAKPAPVAAPVAKVPAVPVSVPTQAAGPRAADEPGAACAGMNFFSTARCLAEQCRDARFKPHPQCEAVRRQQRLDEERRNPPMAN